MTRLNVMVAVAMFLALVACAEQNAVPAAADRVANPSPVIAKAPRAAPSPIPTRTPVPTATAVVATPPPTAERSPVPTTRPSPVPTWTPKARRATPTATPIPDAVVQAHMTSGKGDEKASDFELTLFGGETLRLSDLEDQVVVLNFWASWCPPCRWEMPSFEKTYQEYKEQGVMFVGVAISDFESAALKFAGLTGVTYPIGLDITGEISRAYRVLSLPTTLFIDHEGNVARRLTNVANEAVLNLFIEGQIRQMTNATSG